MRWIKNYQLFLFDFDGLLVSTEEIHFEAYKRMCKNRGVSLDWDFKRFCLAAHYSATELQRQILQEYPTLIEQEPNWQVLYAEKKDAYLELLNEGAVHLMPGVEDLLLELERQRVKRAVVTHSPLEQIEVIRRMNPVLDSIPTWITRELYTHPKPHPEAYQKAIDMLSDASDKIVGFEDTPRGLQALMGTDAKPVLICSKEHPALPELVTNSVSHYTSFLEITDL
ncbi:MAG: HAD family phosphatase [Chlamydiales bacterium]|nr:HAD family phosphatase [Chlamydiales bacterium]